jgi:hypothetical protein
LEMIELCNGESTLRLGQKGLSGKWGSGRNAGREHHPRVSATGNL